MVMHTNQIPDLERQVDTLKTRVAELEEREKAALYLLSTANCPECGGSGIVTGTETEYDSQGDPYPVPIPEPCDWCRVLSGLLSGTEYDAAGAAREG